ncbi:ABC transporter FGM5 [Cladobotryum mycophilum]|uniref:ABC transporter FGM5 n=1 Tax=Cladobotryum mycophilum TaxID=491253 RepID=A0ABR0SCW7_9HYPO
MTLKGLNISIATSSLTIVVGPVASGKSTFCKALLGETPIHSGRVQMTRASLRVGYCEQVPFILNATIRENIVGYSVFDQARYSDVIAATMLAQDLSVLPQADDTKVGNNGITLSGGQKQRVSLARALYLESDLLILDDIFSGLDADTEEHVFQRVFGRDGLVRRRNTTAIICTHSVRHLSSADHIIALGPIVEQGTFEDLVAGGNYLHRLGVTVADRRDVDRRWPAFDKDGPGIARDAVETPSLPQTDWTKTTPPLLNHGNERSRQVGDSVVYRHYATSVKLLTLLSFFFADAAIGFFWNYPNIWLTYWSEDIMASRMVHDHAYWVGIYALLSILCLVFLGIAGFIVFIVIIAQSGTTLHHRALRTVVGAPLRFFTQTDAGVVTNLFSQDMTLIDTELPQSLFNMMISIFVFIGMVAVVTSSSPYIAIGYPFLAAMLWAIQRFYLRTSRQLRLMDLEAKSPTHFADTITGMATLRAFGWVDDSIKLNNRLVDDSQCPAYLLAMIQHWLTLVLQLVVAVIATLVVVLTTQIRLITGTGFIGASLVTLMSFGDTVTLVIRMYTMLETSLGAVSRLKSFSDDILPENSSDKNTFEPPQSWPPSGAIEIKEVSASYAALEDNEAGNGLDPVHLALNNVTMSIKANEKVAICGRSGSGKSSFLLLLLRLLDPVPGCEESIKVDGVPLSRIDRSVLRQRIIGVSQDPIFLPDSTSIKANLDPFGTSSDDECRDVLEIVGLWPLIEERGGLDMGIQPNTYSEGQRQLFNLARAILRRRIRNRGPLSRLTDAAGEDVDIMTKPLADYNGGESGGGVLLLDEVSSSVDQGTDRKIQAIIKREFKDYTIVMVSHRLDIVMDFDKVFILDSGRMIESGNPRELVNQQGSAFQKLWTVGEDRTSTP